MTAPGNRTQSNNEQSCPTDDELLKFSTLALQASDGDVVRSHVYECLDCQHRLDRLTHSTIVGQQLDAGTIEPSGDSIERLVNRLCEACRTLPSPRSAWHDPISLSIALEPGTLGRLGHYSIRRELAISTSATVFEARDDRNGAPVALKLIHRCEGETLMRVEREAQALLKIQHAHVVPLQAIERLDDGRLVLVMPFISGSSLAELLARRTPLELSLIVDLFLQLCDALIEVHRQGILHRDLKPGNILIANNRFAWLTDFGLATSLDGSSSVTAPGVLVGTPAYMSPEQVIGSRALDDRSDIYSLGVCLYECLTGERPFRGSTSEILRRILRDDPPQLRSMNSNVPEQMETICLKAMAKEPYQRYQSVSALAHDLRSWKAGEPILARRPGWLAKAHRAIKRRPLLTTVAASITLSLGLLSVGSLWNWRQALRQRDIARSNMQSSIRAVDHFFADLDSSLVGRPGAQLLRKELLHHSLTVYSDFLESWPDDPELKIEFALGLARLANLTEQVGSKEDAVRAWQRAESATRALCVQNHDDPRWQTQLYECLIHRASLLLVTQRTEEGQDLLVRASELLRVLSEKYPTNSKYQKDLASCAGNLGNYYFVIKQPQMAVHYYSQAAQAYQELLKGSPGNSDLCQKLAAALTNAAMAAPVSEKIPMYQRARDALASFGPAPLPPVLSRRLAKVEFEEGHAWLQIGNLDRAVECWRSGAQVLKPVVESNPDVADYRWLLGQLYFALGSHSPDAADATHYLQQAQHHQDSLCCQDGDSSLYRENLERTKQAMALKMQGLMEAKRPN